MRRRARGRRRAEGVNARAKKRVVVRDTRPRLARVGLEREHQTRSFVVPAVPRSRRSRLVGGEGARASPRERTSNISTTDMLVSSSTRRPSVTKVPSSSTSRVRSVPWASRASFARDRASASAPASSRSRGPIAARARVSTGRRRPERHRGDARPPPEGKVVRHRARRVVSPSATRSFALHRSRVFFAVTSRMEHSSSAGARFFRGGCPTRKTTLARSVTLARAHGAARQRGWDTSDVDATEERPAGDDPRLVRVALPPPRGREGRRSPVSYTHLTLPTKA